MAIAATFLCTAGDVVHAQQQVQCFAIEFFYDSSVSDAAELRAELDEFSKKRTGLKLHVRDVSKNDDYRKRVAQIAKYFGLTDMKLPAIYGLKNVLVDLKTAKQLCSRLDQILTVTAYVRNGCPHCRAAKAFFAKYDRRYPALRIVYREVSIDPTAQDEMYELTRRYRQHAASLPVVHCCNGLTIGFDRESTTGRRILRTLDYWSHSCSVEKKN